MSERVGMAVWFFFSSRRRHTRLQGDWSSDVCSSDLEQIGEAAHALAAQLAAGPTFAHGVTKKLLHQEWNMGVDEAIEAEAEAQAICMQTRDFHRAYEAFVAKQKPVFEGN